jgi:hypothetical protein
VTEDDRREDEISAVERCDLATVRARWAGLKGGVFPPVLDQSRDTREFSCGTPATGRVI